jgi:tetratricopeptide (TPR) repeat protein
MERPAALRPLLDAADDIRRLEEYDGPSDLARSVRAVADAIEQALRIRLRNDPGASDEHRLSALSREGLPLDDVIRSLRSRDVISLETAGGLHEVQAAARRASEEASRPADADVVRATVDRLRAELAPPPQPSTPDLGDPGPAPPADAILATDEGAEAVPGPTAVVGGGGRGLAWVAAAFAALFVIGAVWVAVRGGDREWEDAITAFRAGRVDSAAAGFERVLEDRDDDVTAMLYLGRSYRRLGRPEDAAEILRRAVEVDGRDADVRRELGHLFMDLGRPVSAVTQYERALEYDPDDPLNWAALILALRETDAPRAEQLLRDAPDEVRAALDTAPAAP